MSIPVISAYPFPTATELPVNKVSWQPEPQRSVLLIHDMQRYFLRFYGDNNPLAEQLIEQVRQLISWARAEGIPVVYTAQPTEQSDQQRALLNDMWGPGLTTSAPELADVVEPLAPQPDDTVLVKWRYSAFARSELETLMNTWQRDQLLITGIYAHIGCMTTALDAFMRDIQPFMVADALGDFSAEEHQMALDYVAGRCGAVISSDQLLHNSAAAPTLTLATLRQQIAELIDNEEGPFEDDDNLIDFGLDSVQVMELINRWKQQGIDVSFEQLAAKPTVTGWWALLKPTSATEEPQA
ncbi:MAG: isochorismatase family protein [Marinobacterium sp.]|nr:isochorismatase family protein [Marinobacterium sp.]